MTGSKKGGGPGYEYRATWPAFEVTGEVRTLSNVGSPALEQIKAPPEVQRTAPARIYLTVSDDLHDAERPFPLDFGPELCWCQDEAVSVCVPYVRADLAALQSLRDEAVLPCDVIVAPATRIRAGCKLSTLLHCIDTRRNAPPLPDPDPEAFAALLRDLRRPGPAVEAAPQGGDGLLPDALVPVAREWYALCERAAYVDRIRISGKLAEAIVAAVVKGAATPPSAPAVETVSMHLKALDDMAAGANVQLLPDGARQLAALIRRLSAPVPQEGVDEAMVERAASAIVGTNVFTYRVRDFITPSKDFSVEDVLRTALAAGALPQGMVLVPREPTPEMVEAICRAHAPARTKWPDDFDRTAQTIRRADAECGWLDALAAAPAQAGVGECGSCGQPIRQDPLTGTACACTPTTELDEVCRRRARELGDNWDRMGEEARAALRAQVLGEAAP